MMLEGKVVVIAGGAGTVGAALARRVAAERAVVIVADLDAGAAASVARQIATDHGPLVEPAALDITDKSSITALLEDVRRRHGRIDATLNTAYPRADNYGRRLEDVTYADFCRNVDVHLGGFFLLAQQSASFFRSQGYGHVISMASIYGVATPRFEMYEGTRLTMPVEYAAIKSSIIHLTRYFARYYKGTGVRVNCVSPGGILEQQPASFVKAYNSHCSAKGMLDPGDIAGTVVFLISDESRYVNGQNLIVDDGWTL